MDDTQLTEIAQRKFERPGWFFFPGSIALILIGLGFQSYGVGTSLEEFTEAHKDIPIAFDSYLVLQFVGYFLAIILFPITLRHDPRELTSLTAQGGRVFPGPRKTMVATVLLAALAFSPGAGPFILITAISLAARPFSKWTWFAACAYLLSFTADLFISWSPATSENLWDKDLWYILGFLTTPILIILPSIFIGLHRGRSRMEWWHLVQEAQVSSERVEQQRRLAQREERTRIARDMHDSLSHRLSLIAVHSGALAFRDNLDTTSVRQTATTIRDQAEAAVEDLRTVLSALQEDGSHDQDPRVPLEELVQQARIAGDTIVLDIDSTLDPSELDTLGVHAMHRVVQECLTNARKHAPRQTVTIKAGRKREQREWMWLQISNPIPIDNVASQANFGADTAQMGLAGLAERVKLSGGTFAAGPRSGLFVVDVELPVAASKKKMANE